MNIRVISVLLCAVCFCSCVERSEYWQTIKSVEPYIEERPDSALVVLQGMNTRKLSEGEERAKYALYLSMAMDKNYIDRTDFDVLLPAKIKPTVKSVIVILYIVYCTIAVR